MTWWFLAGGEGSMTVARDEGSPERLGGALRRLHYKATRRAHTAAARHHNSNPPKVRFTTMLFSAIFFFSYSENDFTHSLLLST
jgi:hypothetical protein